MRLDAIAGDIVTTIEKIARTVTMAIAAVMGGAANAAADLSTMAS
jgi:hypothetical protein